MSKRKPARTIKARSASKIRSKAAGSGQPKGRANSKQARVLALLCGPSGATRRVPGQRKVPPSATSSLGACSEWMASGPGGRTELEVNHGTLPTDATYHAACRRWPDAHVKLRKGDRVIADSHQDRPR
jgi:hypothetical protein